MLTKMRFYCVYILYQKRFAKAFRKRFSNRYKNRYYFYYFYYNNRLFQAKTATINFISKSIIEIYENALLIYRIRDN